MSSRRRRSRPRERGVERQALRSRSLLAGAALAATGCARGGSPVASLADANGPAPDAGVGLEGSYVAPRPEESPRCEDARRPSFRHAARAVGGGAAARDGGDGSTNGRRAADRARRPRGGERPERGEGEQRATAERPSLSPQRAGARLPTSGSPRSRRRARGPTWRRSRSPLASRAKGARAGV